MHVDNKYWYFKSVLSPDQCRNIIDSGLSKIEESKKNDSQFWLDLKNISLPDNLQENLELWKNRLPIEDDFQYCSKYKLFTDHNYILVLYGLGLLNVENIKKQYDKLPGFVKNYIYGELSKEQNLEIDEKYMTHKSFINKIRS